MVKRRRSKRQNEETGLAQTQHTAPPSGLNEMRSPKASGFRRRFTERTTLEGKQEQRGDRELVRQCLESGRYPEFE